MRLSTNALRQNKDWRSILVQHVELWQASYNISVPSVTLLVSRLYTPFKEATQDEVGLCGVDLQRSRICGCDDPYANMIIDGTAVSTQTQAVHVLGPYYPAAGDEELSWGSKYQERIVLGQKGLRDGVLLFATSTAETPMSAATFNVLHQKLLDAGQGPIAALLCGAQLATHDPVAPDGNASDVSEDTAEARRQHQVNEDALFRVRFLAAL